jgi:4-alpha-glucanotransferase
MTEHGGHAELVRSSLSVLGVERLVLVVHEASFPSLADEDIGRGSPYTQGGERFLEFVAARGFTAVQLGPQGQTTAFNPSPYDSTALSRGSVAIALAELAQEGAWGPLLGSRELEAALATAPAASDRADHRAAQRIHARLMHAAQSAMARELARPTPATSLVALSRRVNEFRARHRRWLEADALYAALREERRAPLESWPELDRTLWAPPPGGERAASQRRADLVARHETTISEAALAQLIVHEQHARTRERARGMGLELHGDVHVGLAGEDAWREAALFLPGYRMGAPPSRTNPAGQPWGYPVLDPARWRPGEAAADFVVRRMHKLFDDYAALRIDHPHGLVCPWVYRDGTADALAAVQAGARLRASPDLPDHPELAAHAVVAPDDIDNALPRYHDAWVRRLSDDQVAHYALLFDQVVACALDRGHGREALICEVLSTQPRPLAKVLERHGLGRFRVTQKARLDDPDDVYRSEQARPEDWIMVGTHDTPSLWAKLDEWTAEGSLGEHAQHLATLLTPAGGDRRTFEASLRADPGRLAQAKLAELFVARATNVMIFFADWFGLRERYNLPGSVSDANWTLRVPRDYQAHLARRAPLHQAADLRYVLALALRARGGETALDLAQRLEALPP